MILFKFKLNLLKTGQSYLFDWSSEEEKEENANEDNETEDDQKNIKDDFGQLFDSLKEHDWFKLEKRPTIENILKYLVNKLAERNNSNHNDVSNYIRQIIS